MNFVRKLVPSWQNVLLALLAAILLILAFPDFELWFLAWFALAPLMWAVEGEKASAPRSFVLGWIFGIVFFTGTCWWLTFAPVTYAGFPPVLAYFLLFCVTAVTGLFPAVFAGVLALLLRRFGTWAFFAAPFVWVFTEFLRYWMTGNNWNAIGYSQAAFPTNVGSASLGGVYLVGFFAVALAAALTGEYFLFRRLGPTRSLAVKTISGLALNAALFLPLLFNILNTYRLPLTGGAGVASVIAVQPNVPMSGLDQQKWNQLRQRQIGAAEAAVRNLNERRTTKNEPILVILPESPMNFMYEDDREFQMFINEFARRNNVSVLFNSAEPDKSNGKYFNSAVMVGPEGKAAAQYDKIYLLPFGEAVPAFLEGIVPGFVGNFSYGREYDLLPLGDARAGVMICFESHFGQLSREYVRSGADVIIEMTNDGYLGPTPVLTQHLANAVFRAVETNRPVLRATNVGITAYINERGDVIEPTAGYTEDVRTWSVSKSDSNQTFYVRYGDWFAWVCSLVTIVLFGYAFFQRKQSEV